MYYVCRENDVTAYETRSSAVLIAKDLSDTSRDEVSVVAEDFREVLRYRGGDLVQYVCETRNNRWAVH